MKDKNMLLLKHVEQEVNSLEFGRVVIEIRNGRAIDVITEKRVRMPEEAEEKKYELRECRNG